MVAAALSSLRDGWQALQSLGHDMDGLRSDTAAAFADLRAQQAQALQDAATAVIAQVQQQAQVSQGLVGGCSSRNHTSLTVCIVHRRTGVSVTCAGCPCLISESLLSLLMGGCPVPGWTPIRICLTQDSYPTRHPLTSKSMLQMTHAPETTSSPTNLAQVRLWQPLARAC